MKHYLYTAEDDFRTYIIVAPNQQEVKKLIKEITGCAMCRYQVCKLMQFMIIMILKYIAGMAKKHKEYFVRRINHETFCETAYR